MEAEMSLVMANQALVSVASSCHEAEQTDLLFAQAAPGKLIYDPFVGTGSMVYVSITVAANA